jgi:AraC-like DNA-binding protein
MATTLNPAENAPATSAPSPERIMQLAWGYAPPLILETAIRHHVFDVLDSGPLSLSELAQATGASERGLAAILNVLLGLNFLAKDAEGQYSLTPESAAFLVSTKPTFQGGILRHTSEHLLPKWLRLHEIVSAGAPDAAVNRQETGSAFFENFVNDIFPMSYPAAQDLAHYLRLDLMSGPVSVLDLAAGSGRAHPQ